MFNICIDFDLDLNLDLVGWGVFHALHDYFLLYNREPKLPVDAKYETQVEPEELEFNEDYVAKLAQVMQDIKERCRIKASENIARAQAK